MAKGLFHVSMIVDAGALYAVTTAAADHKARDVNIQPVPDSAGKKNGAEPGATRVPLRTVLMPWWVEHKQFSMKDAILFGAGHGYTKGAVYTATLAGMKQGLLERTGPGDYKTLPALAKTLKAAAKSNGAEPAAKPRATPQRNDVVHTDFVLGLIKQGEVTYKSIRQKFEEAGRKPRSIDGALGKLKAEKKITNSGPGEYKLLAKGAEHLKTI